MFKPTSEQEKAVRNWAGEGDGLSEIQKKLSGQFGVSVTYMDVRFLVIDLGIELKERKAAPSRNIVPEPEKHPKAGDVDPDVVPKKQNRAGTSGNVVVTLDVVMRPGSVVSGTVQFSDGVSASWYLDQYGRLALDAGQPGYSPGQEDLQSFQQELRKELEKRGF